MTTQARVKLNPITKEFEIEGSEKFVKAYFEKIQGMLSGIPEEIKAKAKTKKAVAPEKAKKAPKAEKAVKIKKSTTKAGATRKAIDKESLGKVMAFIKESPEGIGTRQLKEKTGLTDQQIRGVIYRAEKQGLLKKAKRGLYVAVLPG